MKKLKILILIIVMSLMCGCVKLNSEMTIYENGTIDMSILFATNNDYYSDLDSITDSISVNMDNRGYDVLPYNLNNYRGYTFSKTISSIDNISSNDITSYSIENFLYINDFVFQKTKNIYKAKLIFPEEDRLFNIYYNQVSSEVKDNQYSSFDFIVNLPYASLDNNADQEKNDGKTLIWQFSKSNIKNIEFEFSLNKEESPVTSFNWLKLFIIILCFLIILIIVLLILKARIKKRNKKKMLKEINVNVETLL